MVHAQLGEDLAVLVGDRLRPDGRHLELENERGGEDAGLEVPPDRHDDAFELRYAQLLERLRLGRVGAHHVREQPIVALHDVFAVVDAEHLGSTGHQLDGERTAESAEPDDDDGAGLGNAVGVVAGEERELIQ